MLDGFVDDELKLFTGKNQKNQLTKKAALKTGWLFFTGIRWGDPSHISYSGPYRSGVAPNGDGCPFRPHLFPMR